jgi:plasmid stabilization system protein ParE
VNWPVLLRPEAEADTESTHDFLENIQLGLGKRFLSRLREILSRIETMPNLHAIVHSDVRAARLRGFLYVVYYIPFDDRIEVIAVMHGSQDPDVWQNRITST